MTNNSDNHITKKSDTNNIYYSGNNHSLISPASVIKNSFLLILLQLLTKITGFITSILLANYLGAALFGVYSYAFALSAIFIPFCDFGLDILLMREIAKNPSHISQKYLGATLKIKSLLSTLLTITIILLAGILESFYSQEYQIVVIAGLITILRTFSNSYGSAFKATNKVSHEVISFSLLRVVEFSFVIYAVLTGIGLVTLLLMLFAVNLFGVLIIFQVVRKTIKPDYSYDTKFIKQILRQSAPFAITAILSAIYFNIGTVLVLKISGDEFAGLYRSVYNIIFPLTIFSVTISSAIFPFAAQNYRMNKKQVSTVVSALIKYFIIATIPISILLTFFSNEIVGILFSSEYAPAAFTLSILSWLVPSIFLTNLFGSLLGATDEQGYVLKITSINVLINLILNSILIFSFSHNGAAATAVITEIIALTFLLIKIRLKFDNLLIGFRTVQFISLIFLMAIISILKIIILPLIAAAFGLLIYLSGLFIFKIISQNEIIELKKIFKNS